MTTTVHSLVSWHDDENGGGREVVVFAAEGICRSVVLQLRPVAARAFRWGGASCLLAAPRNVWTVRVDHFSYPTRISTRSVAYPHGPYPTRAKDFYPDYIGTGDCHNPISSQSNEPIIGLPLPSRPNDDRTVSYGYRYTRGSGRVGSSRSTEPTLTPIACAANLLRKWANWGWAGERARWS